MTALADDFYFIGYALAVSAAELRSICGNTGAGRICAFLRLGHNSPLAIRLDWNAERKGVWLDAKTELRDGDECARICSESLSAEFGEDKAANKGRYGKFS